MKRVLYVLTGFCLLAGIFASCEKPNENNEGEGGGGSPTEQTGAIRGTVSDDATRLPLELTLVELTPGEKRTMTDDNGAFLIEGLTPGNYKLKVSRLGYKTVEKGSVTVKKGNTTRQDIKMEQEQSDLRIVNENNEDIEALECNGNKATFKILNAGSNILEWEIPVVAAEWVKGFSKESGKLTPGASEKIEISLMLFTDQKEAVVYIMSNDGNKQLRLRKLEGGDYTETAFDIKMEMVYVEGGELELGKTEEQGYDEVNGILTTVSSYYIGRYEVTQAQWKAVMGTSLREQRDKGNPQWKLVGEGDNYPMYYVSWDEAKAFCEKLSEKTGEKYVLPMEEQWEYAARGGSKSQYFKYSGGDYINEVAWYKSNSGETTHPVGTKKANELGIYDMTGNVMEYCSEVYSNNSGKYLYMYRGGDFLLDAGDCRVSVRYGNESSSIRGCNGGFRVACIAE